MVKFYRDSLNGVPYIIVALVSLFFIMAIIGFIMERLKLEKEAKESIAHVGRNAVTPVTPIEPVSVETNEQVDNSQILASNPAPAAVNDDLIIENFFKEPDAKTLEEQQNQEINESNKQNQNVIIFDDPDEPKE